MTSFLRLMRILTAFAVILSAFLLCFQCIDIYADSCSNSSLSNAAIFSPEEITTRLSKLAIPLVVCGAVIIATILLQAFSTNATHPECTVQHPSQTSGKAVPSIHRCRIKTILLITALAFILLGVANGGAYEVLVKAINICTECIGLG